MPRYTMMWICEALEVFDSWAGILEPDLFLEFCLPYQKRICKEIKSRIKQELGRDIPMTLFAKGANFHLTALSKLGYDMLSIDWCVRPSEARARVGNRVCLQVISFYSFTDRNYMIESDLEIWACLHEDEQVNCEKWNVVPLWLVFPKMKIFQRGMLVFKVESSMGTYTGEYHCVGISKNNWGILLSVREKGVDRIIRRHISL